MYDKDSIGWTAALISAIAFGSFAVPIKGDAANSVNIDPLCMQTYKTTMCFVTAWIVLLLPPSNPTPLTFTPWGIVSGMFWVPGGTFAIFAVRNAGLAVSQGTWSSMIVAVSFIWGIFGFHEGVKSRWNACAAVMIMMVGLWGMSYYSHAVAGDLDDDRSAAVDGRDAKLLSKRHQGKYVRLTTDGKDDDQNKRSNVDEELTENDTSCDEQTQASLSIATSFDEEEGGVHDYRESSSSDHSSRCSDLASVVDEDEGEGEDAEHILFMNILISRRVAGLISAFLCGIWGGSIMVPMHYAPEGTGGLGYVISFAVGSALINLFMWICRYFYNVYLLKGSIVGGYNALPSFHFQVMWRPGMIAGVTWSIGNIASILSVEYLGEGVGYSVVQSAMLISGLWGIFWFKEIRGTATVAKWLVAACITVLSIILLSYEHKSATPG
mmetsp:Transcript_11472/g.17305  ORF Transcript_11472/g.17305 Transcript_11472/m.17305 type:complete len:438 (+) Transcript_11472:74-1387(+)